MDHKHLSADYSFKSAFEHYRWKGCYIKYQLLLLLLSLSLLLLLLLLLLLFLNLNDHNLAFLNLKNNSHVQVQFASFLTDVSSQIMSVAKSIFFLYADKPRTPQPIKAWSHQVTGSDTESASGSSKSRDSSPSASPHNLPRRRLVQSASMDELAEVDKDTELDTSRCS